MGMYSIAIDGPAGAGKSTIARAVAKKLGFVYVDTGAMYRALALFFLRRGISGDDVETISSLCPDIRISLDYDSEGQQQMYLNGENVTSMIRQEEVGKMASVTSAIPAVRSALLSLQRQLAKESNVLMDGRDIGTHVLVDATLKIFLTASVDVRARRRYDELTQKGEECDFDQIRKDIEQRDHQDMTREISPLYQAEDAVAIDSSSLTIDQVIDRVIELFRDKTESSVGE